MLRRVVQQVQSKINDSASLASALILARRNSSGRGASKTAKTTTREILLEQAQWGNNTIARSILHADRAVNLVRYHGLFRYLTDHLHLGQKMVTWKRFHGDSQQTPPTSIDTDKTAKVAFMITSAQKAHLKDILGYDPSHIRTLTPLQASIIVENDLPPGNGELVERLLQEHEALRRMELEKQSLELQRKLDSNAISRSRQEYCTTDSPNRWFSVIEVVTHRNDDRNVKTHESTVALYRKEEEARLCVDLKTDFARRAGQSHVTYRVTDGQSS